MIWTDEHLRGRIRYKTLQLDAGSPVLPRYFAPDLRAFLLAPPMREALEFVPVFKTEPIRPPYHVPSENEMAEMLPLTWRIEHAARYLDVSRDSIESRMIPWQSEPEPYRIRYSQTELKIGRNIVRVCYRPDVEALLKESEGAVAASNKYHRTGNEGRTQ